MCIKILRRAWAAIQDGHARTTPNRAIGFLFVPLFNLYWVFVALHGFALDYNAFVTRHRIRARQLSEVSFRAYCAFTVLATGLAIVGFLPTLVAIVEFALAPASHKRRNLMTTSLTKSLPEGIMEPLWRRAPRVRDRTWGPQPECGGTDDASRTETKRWGDQGIPVRSGPH